MTRARQPKSFLIATWEGGGCVAPALTVARKLIARGHAVRVISDEANRHEAEAVGARFTAWTRAPSRPDRRRETEVIRDWAEASPVEGLMRTIENIWMGPSLAYAEDVMETIRREPVDLVITSEMLFGVVAACEALGQAHVLLCAQISVFPQPGTPPMGPGLAPAVTPAEAAMHAEITAATVGLFDHGLPALNATRQALGLPPLIHALDQAAIAKAILLCTARAFDFAPKVASERIRYVGPQLDQPTWTRPFAAPWPADDARPLVLVGFSTTFQNHVMVLQRVADALGELPVRGLITLGETILPSEIEAPANVALVHSAPHDQVLREASVVVTHGGHGTVIRALIHGRPLLVMPHGRDQADNAIRVSHRAAGLQLTPDAPVTVIRDAVARLLAEPAFTAAARALGERIAAEAAADPVVEELEELAEVRRPALCSA